MKRINKIQQNPFITSTLRQPLRTFFLVLLVGMISFAFIGKAVEYLIVQRETNRLGSYYHAIGSLRKIKDPDDWDISKGAEIIKNSPYLAYEDRREYSYGAMEGIYNTDFYGLDAENSGPNADVYKDIHIDSFWFYGVLNAKKEIFESEGINSGSLGYSLTFTVDKIVTGYPEYIQTGKTINLLFISKNHEDAVPVIAAMQAGQRYFVRGWFDTYFIPGPGWQNEKSKYQIHALDDQNNWYIPVAEGGDVNFNDPNLAVIKNELEIEEQNKHMFTINTTTDMSAMPETQQASRLDYLVDGRWLNHEDDLHANQVMVIQDNFAKQRGLKVGDTVTMDFRTLKEDTGWGYITSDEDRENWRGYSTISESFTIVGTFGATVIMSQWVYIPTSTLPAGFAINYGGLSYGSYSFVLKSFQDENALVNETQDKLAQLGIGLSFVDNNGKNYWAGVTPLKQSAQASLAIFGVVLLIALALVVFLYLTQRRRDYAIMRALGVPRVKANHELLLPITLIGALGILAGGVSSWQYALGKAAASLSTLPTPAGIKPSTTLNIGYLAALCGGIFLLLTAFAWFGIQLTAKKPVLELLQGEASQTGKKQISMESAPSGERTAVMSSEPVLQTSNQLGKIVITHSKQSLAKKHRNNGTLVRFVLRRINRSNLRSFLIIAVAAGFVLALGWMQWTMDKNRAEVDHLYATTIVEADIEQQNSDVSLGANAALISSDIVDKILKSGYVKSAYLEANSGVIQISGIQGTTEPQEVSLTLIAINQPEQYFSTTLGGAVAVYAPGWDSSLFTKEWTLDEINQSGIPAVFPESLFSKYNLKMGDTLSMTDYQALTYQYIVAGEYSGGTIQYAEPPILLPLSVLSATEGNEFQYSVARFEIDPAKNKQLQQFKSTMDRALARPGAGLLPLKIVFWDEELRTVVTPLEKNLSLIKVLYPVTAAISVLIGAGLCLLLALQSARVAALLRVLGVTTGRVRIVLSCEHLLLSLIGVLLGLGILILLRGDPAAVVTEPTLIASGSYLAGVLIGSVIGAISVTLRKPMELLQVKE